MWLPVKTALSTGSRPDKLSLFLCQAWHQLLSPDSPDSYRSRVMDLPLLIDELGEVATWAMADQRLEAQLDLIRDEIRDAIKSESRFLAGRPDLRSHVAFLTSQSSKATPRQTRDQVDVVRSLWGDPLRTWCEDASSVLGDAVTTGHRRELLHRLSTLASHVQKAEAQHAALALLSDELCFKPPNEVLAEICNACVAPERHFNCYIAVQGSRSDLFRTLHRLSFVEPRRSAIRCSEQGRSWLDAHEEHNLVTTALVARSSRLAAESALDRLTVVTNLHNLYKNADSLRPATDVLVLPQGGDFQLVRVTPAAHFGLKPRRNYSELTRGRLLAIGDRIDGRIANALEAHTIALAADDAKISLLNLWTALETLTGPIGPGSIGTRVADKISPIIAWRRADKIVTSLTISLNSFCKVLSVKRDPALFPASNSHWVSTDDVCTAITGPSGNPTIKHIFSIIGDRSPLLSYRFLEAWGDFSDPATLKSRFASSQSRVKWQLLRIYRARNLLVHQGKTHRVVWRLLQNAQYYLSTALGRVLHDLCSQETWDVDRSLEYQRMRYEYVIQSLVSNSPLVRRDLLAGKTANPNGPLWPPSVPKAERSTMQQDDALSE